MSSSEDDEKPTGFPVPLTDVSREVRSVIEKVGINQLKSKAVREHLKEKFNVDFAQYKSQVDEVIKDQIVAMEEDKKPKKVAAKKEDSPSASDSDSDPGVASTGRMPGKKRRSEVVDNRDEDDDLHSAVKRRRAAPVRKPRTPKEKKAKGKGPGRGSFGKVSYISDDLMALTGKRYMPRHAVVSFMWNYVKTKELYDPKNKQYAVCDDALKVIFKKTKFRLFGMMKNLTGHIIKPEEVSPEAVEEAKAEDERLYAEKMEAAKAEMADGDGNDGMKEENGDNNEDDD